MVLHVAKSPFSSNVAHIRFPAEADKVRYDVFAVEEFGGWATAHIIGGDGAANVPASYIERDALFSEAGVQKLNSLAELVDEYYIIGDCNNVGQIYNAMNGAYFAALRV